MPRERQKIVHYLTLRTFQIILTVEHLQWCSVCDPDNLFLTSKLSYFLFFDIQVELFPFLWHPSWVISFSLTSKLSYFLFFDIQVELFPFLWHPSWVISFSLTSKFNYLLFCNPNCKTETGTANRWGSTNSKPSGRIIMMGPIRHTAQESYHIFYTLFALCTLVMCLFPAKANTARVLSQNHFLKQNWHI